MLRLLASLWKLSPPQNRKKAKNRRLLIDGLETRIMFASDLETVVASSSSASASSSFSASNQAINTTNIDLAIEAGIHHLQSILDASNGNMPYFWVWALTRSQAQAYGDNTQGWRPAQAHLGFERHLTSNSAGRATYALLLGAEAIGASLDPQVMAAYEKYVLKSLHKPRNGNWNDLSPANQMITGLASDPRFYGSQQFDMTHLFNMGAGLRGALGLATLTDDGTDPAPGYLWSSKEVFEVSVYNIRKYYVYGGNEIGGTRAYNWEVFRQQLGLQGGDAWLSSVSAEIDNNWSNNFVNWASPFLVHDLVKYYEATGHQPSLELAKELRDYAFYQAFPLNPSQVNIPNGSHGFEVAGEMNAYSRLALVLGDADMMERVRVRYEALRGRAFNSTGWFAEFIGNNSDMGEINNTAELIETALNFAEFGWTQYYEDVERFTRGHLLPSQLLDTSFVIKNTNTTIDGQKNIDQRVFGAFGFPAPYGQIATKNPINIGAFHADVTAGAVATLAEIKKAIHHFGNGLHEINLLFDFDDSQINIRSPYPEGDRLTITTKVAGDVRVRLPSWADKTAVAASLTQQGLQFTMASDSVLIRGTQVGQAFYVAMPLPFVRLTDRVNGRNITIDWRGDSVFAMSTMGTPMPFFPNVTSTPPTSPAPAPVNQPPVVNAGPDRTIFRGTVLALSGTATDDGYPTNPGALQVSWSKLAGPGGVTFSNVNSKNTNVGFSVAGDYLLRFTASDGQLSRSDEVLIRVIEPISTVTVAFQDGVFPTVAYQGTRDTKISSTAPVSGHGTKTALQLDGTPDMAALMAWDLSAIPQGSMVVSAAIELFVTNSTKDSYEVYALQRAWEELTATWFNSDNSTTWSIPGADGSADAASTVLGQLSAPQVGFRQIALNQAGLELVQAWIDDPAYNFGIIFKDYLYGDDAAEISSREASIASQRPKLVVTYMPVSVSEEEEPPPVVVPNEPPQVNAGADQSIQLPNSATLHGIVSDDALPASPGNVVTAWSKISGPGNVTFNNAASVSTSATFSAPGTYVLRLTANDGELSAFDEITIEIQPEPVQPVTISFQDGVFPTLSYSGTRDTKITSTSPVATHGNVTKIQLDGTPDMAALMAWDISAIPAGSTITSASIELFITNTTKDSYEVYALQRAWNELAATWYQFDHGSNWTTAGADGASDAASTVLGALTAPKLGFQQISLNQAGINLVQTWLNDPAENLGIILKDYVNGNDAAEFYTSEYGIANQRPKLVITYLPGTPTEEEEIPPPTNQAPQVNAGADQTIQLPNSATLIGVVTDDGLPASPGSTDTTWSKISGPGTVTFGNAASKSTTVSFSAAGTYVLRLTANDGQLSAFDEVTISVHSAPIVNHPPQVNAGVDQTIQLPASASLVGTVSDDGLPASPGTVGTAWSKVSGPGTVTFGNAGSKNTTASFSAAGTYVLRLSANDGQFQVFDEVTITVQPAPVVNQAPQVQAGADQSIQLPSSANLNGIVTDDGLPASPGALTTTWTRISGPGTVTFANAGAKNTTASFSAAGTYVLRLTANDGQLSAFDEITITVQPAPFVNQPPQVNAGADRTLQLPGSLSLAGTVTDDGQPTSPGAVTTTWTRISGPGTVTFANVASRNTTATFSAAGTYVLRLTASDGQLQSYDELTVTVIPPIVQHQPPIVNAGIDVQIAKGATTTLQGSVTFTTGTRPITSVWTLISGPSSVSIASPNSLSTSAGFGETGSYILRLTVSDGQFTAFDEVNVTVSKKGDGDSKK